MDKVVSTATSAGVTIAGTGTAVDHTLAVSGSVKGDAGTLEVRVGVGGGAKVTKVALKKR